METAEEFGIRYAKEKAETEAAIKRFCELGLKRRTAQTLINEYIRDIDSLAAKSDEELNKIPGLGKVGLREIRQLVEQHKASENGAEA